MKKIFLTVTNDLSFDQRMHRICHSLSSNGYAVTLVGRKRRSSVPLEKKIFNQVRIFCFFDKGFLFYAEYNLRLFFYLLSKKMDGICAIDLDTILPCYFISRIKKIPRIYDAHEFFTETKEVRTRPLVKKIWTGIENFTIPKFKYGYTVSNGLVAAFKERYQKNFKLIRNLPLRKKLNADLPPDDFIIYTGAVNEARGLETLIPAMKYVEATLVICGDGNFMQQLKSLVAKEGLQTKVIIKGMLPPEELWQWVQKARLGLNLVEREGLNQYYSLANKFFDYMQAGLPQITMNYPEYKLVNDEFPVAVLIDDLEITTIARAISETLQNESLLQTMKTAALQAAEVFTWENEEKTLLRIYDSIFKV